MDKPVIWCVTLTRTVTETAYVYVEAHGDLEAGDLAERLAMEPWIPWRGTGEADIDVEDVEEATPDPCPECGENRAHPSQQIRGGHRC